MHDRGAESKEQYMTPRHQTPLGKYITQRVAAGRRGIDWLLTFEEWWAIWQESGKWELRGVGRGRYCMARNGDVGPYSRENVTIQLSSKNSSDGVLIAHKSLAAAGWGAGRGRGWTLTKAKRRPYQVVMARKYIGSFATQQEAEAAYAEAVALHRGSSTHFEMVSSSPAKSTANACEEKKHIRKPSESTSTWKV